MLSPWLSSLAPPHDPPHDPRPHSQNKLICRQSASCAPPARELKRGTGQDRTGQEAGRKRLGDEPGDDKPCTRWLLLQYCVGEWARLEREVEVCVDRWLTCHSAMMKLARLRIDRRRCSISSPPRPRPRLRAHLAVSGSLGALWALACRDISMSSAGPGLLARGPRPNRRRLPGLPHL